MPRKPDPELPDADTPEALDAWISKARPASELLTGLFGQSAAKEVLAPKRGRPALPEPKEHVNIRLDADIVGAFRETGSGWQTRMNNALRECLKTHPKVNGVQGNHA